MSFAPFQMNNLNHSEQAQRLIQSYRETMNNPYASPQAKQAAERSLAALYQPTYGSATPQEHNNRVLGGYRATLANPNVSEAAKSHARAMLAQAGADPRTQRAVAAANPTSGATGRQDAHLARQLGGYKSALKNPNVSPEAKAHARHMLEIHGIKA